MWRSRAECGRQLADLAVKALIDEAELTPKPGLVDMRSAGCHDDMNLALMKASAAALRDCFAAMGRTAYRRRPDQDLREALAAIGRSGERDMLETTKGVNTHRGAIWALGLLVAGAAVRGCRATAEQIASAAGEIASFPDRNAPSIGTNGLKVLQTYGFRGARGEAVDGFPHVVRIGLPALYAMRERHVPERTAKINTLLSIMASLDDSCLLHRGGLEALAAAQRGAGLVLKLGGIETAAGWKAYQSLEARLMELRASPGGSADLLAAVLFLDEWQSGSHKATESRGGRGYGTVDISI